MMKKLISFICIAIILLSMSITALAGSIPEDLLYEDFAQIFFAEVVYYHPNKEKPDILLFNLGDNVKSNALGSIFF